jgi:hypothetical protein
LRIVTTDNAPHPDEPAWYEIELGVRLDAHWSEWFDGLELRTDAGNTVLAGRLVDQAALHGVLARLRDLGLPLLSVRRLPTPPEPDP